MLRKIESEIKKYKEFNLLQDSEIEFWENILIELEEKLKESDYFKFMEEFQKIFKKTVKLSSKTRTAFYENSFKFSLETRINALKNAISNPYFSSDKIGIIQNPMWIMNADNISTYMNYTAPKELKKETNKIEQNYGEL